MDETLLQSLPVHVQAFRDPEIYPHPVGDINMLQTHISWVFLAGDFAYKIKKPLNLGFLDFSTRARRLKACCDELTLNQRLAPDIYLQVLPVFQHGDRYQLGSNLSHHRDAVDYCLKMIRFDQRDLFDVRLMEKRFDPAWMDQLAETVALFHHHAESSPSIQKFGEPKFLQSHLRECLNVAEKSPQQNLPASLLLRLKEKIHICLEQHLKLLRQRQSRFVKNCHGDLHLKNITLFNNRPTPFDCVEFSDEFRMIDTMSDTAFLVMDCDSRNRSDLGYRFLSRYLEQSGDYDGLKLLPLYLSYRAAVRGKVACLLENELADEPFPDKAQLQTTHDDAEHYFSLAEQYLTTEPEPELFVIGGLSGSGKSHLALLALQNMKAVIIRSDATRKRIAKSHANLPIYGDEMHKLTYRSMFNAAEKTLRAGFTTILDATFLHPASRERAVEIASEQGVVSHFYWLDIDSERLRARVGQRKKGGRDISDADLKVLENQLLDYERPSEPYIEFISDSGHWPNGLPVTTHGRVVKIKEQRD